MKQLEKIILVQFYLVEAKELSLVENTVFLGPNGSGKTSLLDAIQIAMLGAHGNYLAFNSQTAGIGRRSIRDYCLGVYRDGSESNAAADRKRDTALTYITLVFKDRALNEVVSAGVCLEANAQDPSHHVNGLFVLPGVDLSLGDHVEQDDEGMLPLKWNDFRQRIARLSSNQGRTPSIQTRAENYVSELLFQLKPKARHINPRDFLKVFRKSVFLKHIEHVDQFVREYLVDEQHIDKRRAMAQIEEFRRLKQLVDQVEQQLIKLATLMSRYKRLQTEHRKAATAEALSAVYEVERIGAKLAEQEDQLEESQTELAEVAPKEKALELRLQNLRAESEELLRQVTSHPGAAALDMFSKYRRELESGEAQIIRDLLGLTNRYSQLFDHYRLQLELKEHTLVCADLQKKLLRAKATLERKEFDGVAETLVSAGILIKHVSETFGRVLDAARREQDIKDKNFRAARTSLDNLRSGGGRLGARTAYAMDYLNSRGISSKPICNLLTVKDRRWQPAIETLLGGAREALVIDPGQELQAVRAVRELPKDSRPHGVTLIQPEHLRDEKWVDPQNVLVGSLLDGTNATALAYVRLALGKTRCVESEEELEKYPRALTMDCMLSARGGTRALREISAKELQFGGNRDPLVLRQAEEDLALAATELSRAQADYRRLKDIEDEKIKLDALTTQINPSNGITELVAKRERLAKESPVLDEADRATIERLQNRRATIEASIAQDNAELSLINRKTATLQERIRLTEDYLAEQRPLAQALSQRQTFLCQHQDFDAATMDSYRIEMDSAAADADYEFRIQRCKEMANNARAHADTLASGVKDLFVQYLNEYSVSLLDERSDWRKAFTWVQEEHQRLKDTELVNYREQADRARQTAEESFRKDISIRLRECIYKMQRHINDLNSTLKACPPFSNGEQYEFKAVPAKIYERLFKYIMASADPSSADVLDSDAGLQDEVLRLLNLQSDAVVDKTPNPLDDYRLLFSFDVRILQDGQEIGTLSGRTGKASNGEHRTPFYVTAGAALAAAYRIKAGEETTGAGLMLLDEAFNGMDPQNALATAEFLRSLGLQLVMAAPDSDYGKLASVCQTIYEVARFGADVFLENTELKPAARDLLMSDLPSKHPGLLTNAVNTLQ